MIECDCGRRYHGVKVLCDCGLLIEAGQLPRKTVCKFRGDEKGVGSCRCGPFYTCDLKGLYCSAKTPVDDLVELNFTDGSKMVLVMEVDFQGCDQCDDFMTE